MRVPDHDQQTIYVPFPTTELLAEILWLTEQTGSQRSQDSLLVADLYHRAHTILFRAHIEAALAWIRAEAGHRPDPRQIVDGKVPTAETLRTMLRARL